MNHDYSDSFFVHCISSLCLLLKVYLIAPLGQRSTHFPHRMHSEFSIDSF